MNHQHIHVEDSNGDAKFTVTNHEPQIDHHFLAGYIEHEIKRLDKVRLALRASIEENQRTAAFYEAGIAAASPSSRRYHLGLNDCDKKIAEAQIKLSYVEPKLSKLNEQLPILIELGQ